MKSPVTLLQPGLLYHRVLVVRSLLILLLLCLNFGIAFAYRTTTDYLKEMPTANTIRTDIGGSDDSDTKIRQIGALKQLTRMINDVMSGDRGFELSREEQKKVQDYFKAEQELMEALNAAGVKYNPSEYEMDKKLEAELFSRYFSASWQDEFKKNLELKAKETSQFESEQQRRIEEANAYEREKGEAIIREAPHVMQNQLLRLKTPLLLSLLTIAILFFVTRRWRKIKYYSSPDPNAPNRFKYGKHYIQVDYMQGMVSDFKKDTAKRVEGTHGVVLSSQASVEFFLNGLDGTEKPISMKSMDLFAKDGHILTIAGYNKENVFYPLAVRNHSTNFDYYHENNLNSLFLGPKLQTIGCGLTGGMIIGLAGVWLSMGDRTGLSILWLILWIGLGLASGLFAPKSPDLAAIRDFKNGLRFPDLPIRPA